MTDTEAQPVAWKPMTDTAWLDGRDVVLFAHDMEIHARYSPGEWSDDTPISPREYSGAVWSAFDDQVQFEIEEVSHNEDEWHHGPVTYWREPTPPLYAHPPADTLARLQRERDQAVEALREITNPIAAMQQRAEDLGAKLDGAVAFQLANDVGYLQGIARATLAAIGAEDGIL